MGYTMALWNGGGIYYEDYNNDTGEILIDFMAPWGTQINNAAIPNCVSCYLAKGDSSFTTTEPNWDEEDGGIILYIEYWGGEGAYTLFTVSYFENRYVSATGSDTNLGTLRTAPWATITHAAEMLETDGLRAITIRLLSDIEEQVQIRGPNITDLNSINAIESEGARKTVSAILGANESVFDISGTGWRLDNLRIAATCTDVNGAGIRVHSTTLYAAGLIYIVDTDIDIAPFDNGAGYGIHIFYDDSSVFSAYIDGCTIRSTNTHPMWVGIVCGGVIQYTDSDPSYIRRCYVRDAYVGISMFSSDHLRAYNNIIQGCDYSFELLNNLDTCYIMCNKSLSPNISHIYYPGNDDTVLYSPSSNVGNYWEGLGEDGAPVDFGGGHIDYYPIPHLGLAYDGCTTSGGKTIHATTQDIVYIDVNGEEKAVLVEGDSVDGVPLEQSPPYAPVYVEVNGELKRVIRVLDWCGDEVVLEGAPHIGTI